MNHETTPHDEPAGAAHERTRPTDGRFERQGQPQVQGEAQPPATAARGNGEAATAADQSSVDRIAELEAALEAAKAEAAQNWDKYLRERAEMENYKRRIERTYADLARQGRKELLRKVLGALDNLERAISYESATGSATGKEVDAQGLLTGLQMTYAQFKDLLASEGLTEMKTVGEQFDPARHEAVAVEVATDKLEGEIVAEIQKGYLYQDELIRPALVKVATKG